MKALKRTIAMALLVGWSSAASAAGTGGCASFAWPLDTEIAWMSAADPQPASSGTTLASPPGKAILFTLLPSDKVVFDIAPTGKPKGDAANTFGGVLKFESAGEPAIYQVSLAGPGWIDVIQNGKALETQAHTGKSDCDGLRKSVRFKIDAGPFTVQLNGVPGATIKLAVRRAP